MDAIKIVLLHRNHLEYLTRTLSSLHLRTNYPHDIIVVDNNSDRDFRSELEDIVKRFRARLVYSPTNSWVRGFNYGVPVEPFKYVVLSDADIEVPEPREGVCWLQHLVNEMEMNVSIGKLGLALDLDPIVGRVELAETLRAEQTYKKGPAIGDNIVAPVDTTLAIYRYDVFPFQFCMRIGHQSLMRKNYYCCRSSERFKCQHIGWEGYSKLLGGDHKSVKNLSEKMRFFGNHGIAMDPSLVRNFTLGMKIEYWSRYTLSRLFNGFVVLSILAFYNFKNMSTNATAYVRSKEF